MEEGLPPLSLTAARRIGAGWMEGQITQNSRELWTIRAEREIFPPESGAEGRTRTADTRIFSPVLYHLSYLGAGGDDRI